MQFNELQSMLWVGMLESIERFRKGEICYADLIYGLEGAMDAGEYQNKELIRKWYDFWTPLEILYTSKGDSISFEDANNYLSEMELFLKGIPFK